jgi:hypothetical protein
LIDWAKDEQLSGFSGRGTYTTHISVNPSSLAKAKKVLLDLGAVKEVAELRINGHGTPASLMAPYSVEVTKLIHPGQNLIEITAVNSLSNSAIPRPPLYPLPMPGMELTHSFVPRASGLLGPVDLKIFH